MTAAAGSACAYQRLASADGTFSMVAIDQRATLRRLLREAGQADDDGALREFKAAVMESLTGAASAVLTDTEFGLPAARVAGVPDSGTGLIVSADLLLTDDAGNLVDSAIDEDVMAGGQLLQGVDALKFLVLWPAAEDGERRERALTAIGRFVARCGELGILSVVETIMAELDGRLDTAAFDQRLVAAARACADFAPGLYKTQVPGRGQQPPDEIQAVSEQISAAMPAPWVVLSAGVPASAFPAAVRAAASGGASGFLCGQAVWGPSIRAAAPLEDLRTAAVDRLSALATVAGETARPWRQAIQHQALPPARDGAAT